MKRIFLLCLITFLLTACAHQTTTNATGTDENVTVTEEEGTIFTLWPFIDYRSSPATGYSNLSIFGPLFKREHNGQTVKTAIRPFFFTTETPTDTRTEFFALASTESSATESETQIFHLFQKRSSHIGREDEKNETMLFPLYISGKSEKYGEYTSVFPIYGNIYERFWRDEYHYTLFPIYGQTVKNGTTSTNILYPLFNFVSGEKESGFSFWPLYGQAEKEGVYKKRFALWPFYVNEESGLDTNNPTKKLYLIPFYASTESPEKSSTYAPWPFFGVVRDGSGKVIERDFFWPFWLIADGNDSSDHRYLPFYAESHKKETSSRWIMWPFYHQLGIDSAEFQQDKTTLLYFLFHYSVETWPKLGKERTESSLWPFYAWKHDEDGVRTLSMPAPVEPVIWNDAIERIWSPFWRIFVTTWNDKGDSAGSFLWNLFWWESRGEEQAWEVSPLVSYRSTKKSSGFKLLKGLFGYESNNGKTSLTIFWIPFEI